jgi:uncharacterized membrane protein YraQ (UPF0718 family)
MNGLPPLLAREALRIAQFVLAAFAHTWPLWAVSIPLAAAVKLSPIAGKLEKVLSMRPVSAILFATAIGAVSPLCSCSVVPVIFSLLEAGVPIAPVMSFWLASPSMDPEVFFLSVSSIGWPLAVARLAATTLMSLDGGFLTLALARRGFFSGGVLRDGAKAAGREKCSCSSSRPSVPRARFVPRKDGASGLLRPRAAQGASRGEFRRGWGASLGRFGRRFGRELLSSLVFVAKFMAVAYLLEALIKFYLPESWIRAALGAQNAFAVPISTLVGIPFYTTNAQALGLVGGLLGKGMSGGAALSFLIGGATTTLPAMSAVYGITKPRVFAVYLGSAVFSALAAGLLWSLLAF